MKVNNIFALFAMLLLVAQPFAAAGSEPLIQITSYSTVPSVVYPGTLGYLQLSISNNGATTAESVSAYYEINGVRNSNTIGDISVGSSAQVAVPFKVSQSAAGSIQLLNVDIYYSYQSGSSAVSKQSSLSVPLTVKQYKPLEVRTDHSESLSIAPGEKLSISLELKNTGGVVNNIIISSSDNSSFTLDGTTQKSIGSIPSNSSLNVPLTLVSSSDTSTGTYNIPLVFTYMDALEQPTTETLYVGPISVLDSSSQYRIYLEPITPAEIGSQAKFRLMLENKGSYSVSGTLDINSTDTFTPIGVQRVYFDSVKPGETATKEITLGILSSKSSGYYTLPLRFTPNAGKAATYNTGIAVLATPEITISLDSTSSALSVQVANTGNSQVRSVYASARQTGSQTVLSESFMGTLNVDDFASLSLGSAQARSIDVEIRYKDSNNAEHTMKETLTTTGNLSATRQGIQSGSTGGIAGSANQATSAQQRGNNPMGFLFGGRSSSGQSGGFDLVQVAIAAVAVIAVGYFAYRKFFAKKKPSTAPQGKMR